MAAENKSGRPLEATLRFPGPLLPRLARRAEHKRRQAGCEALQILAAAAISGLRIACLRVSSSRKFISAMRYSPSPITVRVNRVIVVRSGPGSF